METRPWEHTFPSAKLVLRKQKHTGHPTFRFIAIPALFSGSNLSVAAKAAL